MQFETKKYIPMYNNMSGMMFLTTNEILKRRQMEWSDAYEEVRKEYGKYLRRVTRLYTSNNWLKMHKQPMRRGLENKEAKGLF